MCAEHEPKLTGSDDDFAAAPTSQAAPQAVSDNSKLEWDDNQIYALCEFVFSILELSGGSDDNPRMWKDIAAKSELWGSYPVSPQELQEVFLQVTV